jgi:hypothetical protein
MKILPLGDKNEPSGVAIFYEVGDDTLEIIKKNKDYYYDAEFVQRCFKDRGRNAHLYLLINNKNTKEIRSKIEKMRKEYKTVSWWGSEHSKFYLRNGVCA